MKIVKKLTNKNGESITAVYDLSIIDEARKQNLDFEQEINNALSKELKVV